MKVNIVQKFRLQKIVEVNKINQFSSEESDAI